MRVLVVDPDEKFGFETVEQLEKSGFEVFYAASPEQMHAQMRVRSIDTLLLDLSLRRMDGFTVGREVRFAVPASELEIVLLSPSHRVDSPEIVSLMRDLESRFFYEKPVDFSRLAKDLNTPRPVVAARPKVSAPETVSEDSKSQSKTEVADTGAASNGAPSPNRKFSIHWDNARALLAIWVQRTSGTVSLSSSSGSLQFTVSGGGLVAEDDLASIKRALRGAPFAFEPSIITEHGDWNRFGRLIFKGARAGSDARTLRKYLGAIPELAENGELIRSLPVAKDTRKFIGQVDGTRTTGDILERGGIPAGDISADVEALVQLGLLHLRGTTPADTEESNPSPRAMAGIGRVESVVHVDVVDSDAAIIQRLEKELKTIQGASPAVVLGIPQDSESDLVDSASERMRNRYAQLIARRDGDKKIRDLAFEMCKRVDEAHRNFQSHVEPEAVYTDISKDWEHDEVVVLLNEGRALIEAQDWAAADKTLTKAHEKRLDNVPVLANLGWARLHNPNVELARRTEEGRDFLLLAEQFDPHDGDGQYFLAQVLVASGRLDAAEQRAKRASDQMKDDPARAALHRKIRQKIASQSEDGA